MAILKESLIYTTGNLITRAQSFLLLPLVTHNLTQSDFGLFETLTSTSMLFTLICLFNFDSAYGALYHKQTNLEDRAKLAGAGIIQSLAIGLCLLWIAWVFNQDISLLITSSPNLGNLLLISFLSSVLSACNQIILVTFRYQKNPMRFATITVTQTFLYLILSMITVTIIDNKIQGLLFASLISNFLVLAFSIKLNTSYMSFNIKESIYWIKKCFPISAPLLPFSIASWTLNLFDRVYVSKILGFDETAIYSFSIKIAQISSLIFSPFQQSWLPNAMESLSTRTGHILFPKVGGYFIFLSGIFIITLANTSELLIRFISPGAYIGSAKFVGILSFCNLLLILYSFSLSRFLFYKKSYLSTLSFGAGAIINVFINVYLTPKIGIPGAIIANVFGYFTMFLTAAIFAHRILPLNFPNLKSFLTIFLLLGLLSLQFSPFSFVSRYQFLFWLFQIIVFSFLCVGLKMVNLSEVKTTFAKVINL